MEQTHSSSLTSFSLRVYVSVSVLVQSRRVSFADPIQQQETADDIDRRSPCIRTSSPRKPRNASSSQPKVQLVQKSKQIIGFCCALTFIVLFQSSMSQHQLRACWSSFPGICIVPATRAPKSVWYEAKSKPTFPLLQCLWGSVWAGFFLAGLITMRECHFQLLTSKLSVHMYQK